jgi:hypothetical protein
MPTGTETMFFIPVTAIPKGKKPTYRVVRIIAAFFRPEKGQPPRRVRFTVRIDNAGDVSIKTADLTMHCQSILQNSVISTPASP